MLSAFMGKPFLENTLPSLWNNIPIRVLFMSMRKCLVAGKDSMRQKNQLSAEKNGFYLNNIHFTEKIPQHFFHVFYNATEKKSIALNKIDHLKHA